MPAEQSIRFYEALKAAGVDARLHLVQGGGHGFDTNEAYATLTEFVLAQAFK